MGDLYKMFKSGKLLKQGSGGGGGGGTSDYENLENLPSMNGHVIKGAMVSSDLDLPSIEDVESKADANETEQALQGKADKSTTYTKTEIDTALSNKADKSTTYTKTEVDMALGVKANSADVYSKTAVDTLLGNKADKSTTYTKTEVDTALGNKANKSTTYTKTEVDTALGGKQAKLTTAQLAAVNSGMTSEDVEQINTNENNILYTYGGTVGKNLLRNDVKTETLGGVTGTTNADGSITLSSTGTINNTFVLCALSTIPVNNITGFSKGVTYKLKASGSEYVDVQVGGVDTIDGAITLLAATGASDVTFTLTQDYVRFRILIKSGADFTTPLTIYPMATLATNDTTYQPYAYDMISMSNIIRQLLANQ